MTPDNDRALANATAFLRAQLERVAFGELEVRLVLHAGRIARVEKTTVEKEQPSVTTSAGENEVSGSHA